MSHASDMPAKAKMYQAAFHFVAHAHAEEDAGGHAAT